MSPTRGKYPDPDAATHSERSSRAPRRARGLSLVETLLALAITAMLLTATMVATDASFKAYASAAEQASAQASTRMVTTRLLALIRTSTAHGPLEPNAAANPPVTLAGDTIASGYFEFLDPKGSLVRIDYRPQSRELWLTSTPPGGGAAVSQPLLGGVTQATFYGHRRLDAAGLWVLDRGTMDLTVQADTDTTLSLEAGHAPPFRVIASTMPRKLE